MNVNQFFDVAKEIIDSHNAILNPGDLNNTAGSISFDGFITNIKLMGGTTPQRLKSLSFEDILTVLPEHNKIKPIALAKEIATTWREMAKSDDKLNKAKKRLVAFQVDAMPLKDLVEHFDVDDQTNLVGTRLLRESGGKPFIVVNEHGVVDTDRTYRALSELRAGYEPRTNFDGLRVYPIGFLFDNNVDENPLFPGQPLRPGGVCDRLNKSWDGVPMLVRQFIRFMLQFTKSEPDYNSPMWIEYARETIDIAGSENAMEKLRKIYPVENVLKFDEAVRNDKLPRLKVELKKQGSNISTNCTAPNLFVGAKAVNIARTR